MYKVKKQPIDLKSTLVLFLTPIAACVLIPYYAIVHGFIWIDWMWFSFFMVATGISITAGYHRLWSHKSYKAKTPLKIFFMLFGAAALQNSIIKWSSDHRKHHKHVDDKYYDPYSAKKGFWYSHFTWMLRKLPKKINKLENIADLEQDKVVYFQHKNYIFLAIIMTIIVPMCIGACYGSMWGCLLLSGLLRLVLNHHFTFLINSAAHTWGSQNYSDDNTAKDNPLLSIITYGEGYHNFHHKYAGDYRNGVKWYDIDLSKWIIFLFSKIGWTYDLKRTNRPLLEASKAAVQLKRVQAKTKMIRNTEHSCLNKIVTLEKRLEEQYKVLFDSIRDWAKVKQEWLQAKKSKLSRSQIHQLKKHYKTLKKKFEIEKRIWKSSFNSTIKISNQKT